MRLFVSPYVGDIELSKLSVDDVDAMVRGLTAKGYSLAVRRKARGCLSRVMRHAVAKRRVAHNPCTDADRLATNDRDRTKGTLEPEQVRALLSAARGSDWECAIWLLGLLGLRRGEILGLSWQCIGLDAVTIACRSMTTLHLGRLVLGTPKTSASRRTLSLSASLIASLRAHRARQAERRLSATEVRGAGSKGSRCRRRCRPRSAPTPRAGSAPSARRIPAATATDGQVAAAAAVARLEVGVTGAYTGVLHLS
jgi:integrase